MLAEKLTADEFESIHWFGSCFYTFYVAGSVRHKKAPVVAEGGCRGFLCFLAVLAWRRMTADEFLEHGHGDVAVDHLWCSWARKL